MERIYYFREVVIIPVNITTQESNLPLLEQAAAQTGYKVSVIAREGREFTFMKPDLGTVDNFNLYRWVERTVTIEPGLVGISIEKPKAEPDYSPFWKAFNSLGQNRTGN